jgi:hypothetical protein
MVSYRTERRLKTIKTAVIRVLVIVILLTTGWIFLVPPHVTVMETGRSPGDPGGGDLKMGISDATSAVKRAVERLGWSYVGGGSGPGGAEVKASVLVWHIPVPCEVTVRLKPLHGRTAVTVRSESHYGPTDLGQNARNIDAILREMGENGR